jgi:hypothetical protein
MRLDSATVPLGIDIRHARAAHRLTGKFAMALGTGRS